ncbi:hypothetical protein R3P38DRAFT_1757275 [Favolaschia claudopus]|uniref:Uncharacterized protein n=1 Tax=Favolaschia claudopus TaxID=2862362 RepID=A0AAW0DG56_9AGAR
MCLKSNLLGITGLGGNHSWLGRASDPSWLGVEPCGVLSFVVRGLGILVLETRLHSGPSALFELTLHRYHELWSLSHRSTVLRILGCSRLNLVSSGLGSRVLGLGAATRLSGKFRGMSFPFPEKGASSCSILVLPCRGLWAQYARIWSHPPSARGSQTHVNFSPSVNFFFFDFLLFLVLDHRGCTQIAVEFAIGYMQFPVSLLLNFSGYLNARS